MPTLQRRNYCLTSWLEEYEYDNTTISYLISHRELCPDTQRLHHHIYVEFKKPMSLRAVKRVFNDQTLHVEPRNGNQQQAIDYVIKDTNEYPVIEFGVRKQQGKRNDILKAIDMIKQDQSNYDLIEAHPDIYVKYHKGLDKVRQVYDEYNSRTFRDVNVLVLYGTAGTNKTRYAYDTYGANNVYKLNTSDKGHVWFDGYSGQSVLLIDDYYGWIKYGDFLTVIDGYQYRADVKGGHTYARWRNVVITSNVAPETWYSVGLTPALNRRINKIIYRQLIEGEIVDEIIKGSD